ncbi:hypothetical protein L1049_000336 [Liquidambar formosana]|uniref:START domain-containing protein n=1 Tax=Liquidambar formosana TaxID=63359 RepID=A0AAP0NAE3_LIQFO
MSNRSRKIQDRDDESVNENGFEIFKSDSQDRFAKTDRKLKRMKNFVESCGSPGEKMLSSKAKLGLQPDGKSKIDSILESPNDVREPAISSPTRTSQTPPHSPNNGAAEFGLQSDIEMDHTHRATDLLMSFSVGADFNKTKINELAVAAMEELTKMALDGEPLWTLDVDGETEVLNDREYKKLYEPLLDPTLREVIRIIKVGELLQEPNLGNNVESSGEGKNLPTSPKECLPTTLRTTEASRYSDLVLVDPVDLVEWLMDVMTAEFHLPSPLVSPRETYFARYCKQLTRKTWAVVDVSLENIFPNPLMTYRRRPSGCLIQQISRGLSKVTWVEHVEVDNSGIHHMFQPLFASGFAFCARRWVFTLVRQSERIATIMDLSNPAHDGVKTPEVGKLSLFRLADRMVRGFCDDFCGSKENMWRPFPMAGLDDIKLMTRDSMDEPGKPPGTVIIVSTSVWISASVDELFDFLRDGNSRNKWDVLSLGCVIQEEVVHIFKKPDPRNRISIMQVDATSKRTAVLYLQESYTDSVGSYVVYAPMDASAVNMVLNGGNSDNVAILPSGFAILPYTPIMTPQAMGGSLLTIAFQMMDDKATLQYIPSGSIETIYRIVTETVTLIRAAFDTQ